MRSRYTASQREAICSYGKEIVANLILPDWDPIYNIPPMSRVPVIVADAKHPGRSLQWGTQAVQGLATNARAESLLVTPIWKSAAQSRRCLMLADGFFEWETVGKRRVGHCFTMLGRRPFVVAGVWFVAGDHQPDRVVMVTCKPNSLVQPFHDRMPVILGKDFAKEWLTADTLTPSAITRLCRPYPDSAMVRWRSPPEMNSTAFQEIAAVLPWHPEPDFIG